MNDWPMIYKISKNKVQRSHGRSIGSFSKLINWYRFLYERARPLPTQGPSKHDSSGVRRVHQYVKTALRFNGINR